MGRYQAFASSSQPFIGLRPYEYGDHEYFFGREHELDVLLPQVRQKRFVAVVGGSGSGKTSLIQSGLRARIEALTAPGWLWVKVRPAAAPLRNLALGLAELSASSPHLAEAWADRLEQELNKSSFGIGNALELIPAIVARRCLLVVDQFEEVFDFADLAAERNPDVVTSAQRREEAARFVRLLLTAVKQPHMPIHVVIAVAAERLGDCAAFFGLAEAIAQSQFLMPGMSRVQREIVIRESVEHAGGQVDSALVQRVLNDTSDRSNPLPVLQRAMTTCWERAFERFKRGAGERPHLALDDYMAIRSGPEVQLPAKDVGKSAMTNRAHGARAALEPVS